jgi:hypothetical protein
MDIGKLPFFSAVILTVLILLLCTSLAVGYQPAEHSFLITFYWLPFPLQNLLVLWCRLNDVISLYLVSQAINNPALVVQHTIPDYSTPFFSTS